MSHWAESEKKACKTRQYFIVDETETEGLIDWESSPYKIPLCKLRAVKTLKHNVCEDFQHWLSSHLVSYKDKPGVFSIHHFSCLWGM